MSQSSHHRPIDTAEAFDHVCLRPVVEGDEPFLLDLFASTREQELAIFGDNVDLKRAFVTMQYAALAQSYSQGKNMIVTSRDVAIGRTIVDERTNEFRLVDISLLPQFRNQGIGTWLVQRLLDQAQSREKAVTLHVFKASGAVRLYERLGFQVVEDDGTYLKMERSARVSSSESCEYRRQT